MAEATPNEAQIQPCGNLQLEKARKVSEKKRTISTCTLCSTWESVILTCVHTEITGNYFKVITEMPDL